MKKILLASTILVGTAGVAAADNANFTFSGEAYMGLAYSTVAGGTFTPEVSAEFTAGMATMTDMGLEAGAEITITAPGVGMDEDHTSTTFGQVTTTTGSISDALVYLSGDFGKLEVEWGGGTALTGDTTFTYTYSWGDFDLEAYYQYEPAAPDEVGLSGTYNFGDYSVWAGIDYIPMPGTYDLTLGGSASVSGFGLEAEVVYHSSSTDWDWSASADYTTGAFTIGVFAEDDGTDDNIDFGATGSYDLGGGVSVDALVVYDADTTGALGTLGVSMSF